MPVTLLSPVLVLGGRLAIVAIGRAKWVWDIDRGDGKGNIDESGDQLEWKSSCSGRC